MKKDLLITFLFEFFTLGSIFILYKLSNDFFGEIQFSEYSLIKRNIAFIAPVFILGLNIGIPKYVASEYKNQSGIYYYGLKLIFSSVVILSIFLFLFNGSISFLIFGNSTYGYFVNLIILNLMGLTIQNYIYSYLRGRLWMFKANLFQFITLGALPLILIFYVSSVYTFYLFYGLALLVLALAVSIYIVLKLEFKEIDNELKNLIFKYSTIRIPGNWTITTIYAMPVILFSHFISIVEAGYLAFSLAAINMSAQIFKPVGLVLLPYISKDLNNNNSQGIKRKIFPSFILAVLSGILIIIFIHITINTLLSYYLGTPNYIIEDYIKLLILSVPFILIYFFTRSIIDGYYYKAYNTLNLLIALGAMFTYYVTYYLLYGDFYGVEILYGFLLSMVILASLTTFRLMKIFNELPES